MGVKIMFAFFPIFVSYNHGIALLSALCKERGIGVDLHILGNEESFVSHVEEYKPDWIGFSCVTRHDYSKCVPFMKAARRLGVRTMLGGVYPRRVFPDPVEVDLVCCGEGETLPDFLISGDGRLFFEKVRFKDINDLPLPDYDLFNGIPFDRIVPMLDGKKLIPYQSSRGCPFHCRFCETSLQKIWVRIRRKVKEDLSLITEKYSPDAIVFGDALLPYYDQGWMDSWEDFHHSFVAYIRADIEPVKLNWLIDRGLVACAFGVESGDEQYRNEVLWKHLTDEQIFSTIEILDRRGVVSIPFFMKHSPGETFEIQKATHEMKSKLGGYPVMFDYEELGRSERWEQQRA